jgi:hypothetical protein
MDNWAIFVLGLILGIPLSIFANIATPSVRSWYNRSIFSSRKKRVDAILEEYRRIKKYRENQIELGHYALTNLAWGLSQMTILIFVVGFDILIVMNNIISTKHSDLRLSAIFITSIWGIVVYRTFISLFNTMVNIRGYKLYKEQTIKKLIKLGGNPEDLDKEATENG